MAIAFDLPPPALIAPAPERVERVAGTVSDPDNSPIRVLRCQVPGAPPLVPKSFTIAFRISAAELRDFNLPQPTPRVFARIDELTQAHLVISWSVEGFSALYPGANGFDQVRYKATYVAASGAIFVSADPGSVGFSALGRSNAPPRDNVQRANGSCQQVK